MLIVTDRPESPALSYRYPIVQRRLQKAILRYWRAAAESGHGTSHVPLGSPSGHSAVHEGLSLREYIAGAASSLEPTEPSSWERI